MATTKPIPQPMDDCAQDVKANVLAAGVVIPFGTSAVLDGANGAKPFTDTLYQAGATFLGNARGTYDNSAGASTMPTPMIFHRATGATFYKAKGGDVPGITEIGKQISLADNDTVKKTAGASDLKVDLVATDGSTFWRVRLP